MKKVLLLTMMALFAVTVLLTNCSQTTVSSAKIYMNQSEYDQAIAQCEIAIEQKPNNPEAYFIMGQAYGFKRMYREMNDAFVKSLELSNKYASNIEEERVKYWTDLTNSGVASLNQNRVTDAIEQFSMAIVLVPEELVPYKNLAYSYIRDRKDSLAIQVYLDALEIDPTDLETKNFLGSVYYNTKNYDKAIEMLSEVVSNEDPTSDIYAQAVFSLAICYDVQGQSEKAIETYQSALDVAPDDKALLFNMGRLLAQQQNYEQAIEYFRKVLDQAPDDVETLISIGYSYNQLEKFQEAIPHLEKAVELDPNNANAWTNLGISYIRTEQGEKGNAAFEKAKEIQNIP